MVSYNRKLPSLNGVLCLRFFLENKVDPPQNTMVFMETESVSCDLASAKLSENLTSGLEQEKHGFFEEGAQYALPGHWSSKKSFSSIGLSLNMHFLCRNAVYLQFPKSSKVHPYKMENGNA